MNKAYNCGKIEKELVRVIKTGLKITLDLIEVPYKISPTFQKKDKHNIRRAIRRLQEKDLIKLGGDRLALTDKGKKLQQQLHIEILQIKNKSWDGMWRVVAYDIPNIKNKERDYFRNVLKRMDFWQIQKSMWILPYECKEEVAVIALSLGLSPYVIFLKTDHIPKEK